MTQQYDPRVHEDDWTEQDSIDRLSDELKRSVRLATRNADALDYLTEYGQVDGAHHLRWVIDQAVRALTGPDYDRVIADYCAGEDGPETYEWDTGIAP